MAIDYINVSIVSAGRGQTVVGLAAYIGRYDVRNPLTGRKHQFAQDAGDLVFPVEVLVPDHAPEELRDPRKLWVAAERAEVIVDRKTKLPRFRTRAAFAKHVILAVPKELSDAENWELGLEWAKKMYPGVAVMAAMHRADDPEIGNVHVHLLVSTRAIDLHGFGKKARHLDPRFAGKEGLDWHHLESQNLPGQWRAFQEDFFRRKGISLAVDPSRATGGVHWGDARYSARNKREQRDRAATEAARIRMLDPANVLADATANRATFSRQSVARLLAWHGIKGQEAKGILDRIFEDPNTLPLHDPVTGEPLHLFTTRAVRDQEARILAAGSDLAKRPTPPARWERLKVASADPGITQGLSEEQLQALQHVTGNRRLSLVRGLAGAGKSYTMQAMRTAYEKAGYQIVGLAPTNTVVASMAADGFSYATTLHAERYRHQSPHIRHKRWNSRTCLIVDEAGMADSEMMEWLMTSAAEAGAKVILVGDEAQLTSVARGGMFGFLKRTFGAAELREVRRQEQKWAKQASVDLAEGRIPEALAAYNKDGCINWSPDLDSAIDALVTRFKNDFMHDPNRTRFVYCATNAVANQLNDRLQEVQFGSRTDFEVYDCDRGRIRLFPGDRVQFHATEKRLGILNGNIGNVISRSPDEIVVELDKGGAVTFDPTSFTGWGLGYAGTVYRGQGKTLPQAYALYDHIRSWSARSTYVALTRHKHAFDLFVPQTLAKDLDALGKQMSRRDGADASHAYLTAEEAAVRFPKVMIDAITEDGQSQTVNAADLAAAAEPKLHWRLAPLARFSRDYNRVKKAANGANPDHPIQQVLSQAEETARERGFHAWNGKPDPRCLQDFILWQEDGLVRHKSPALNTPKGQIEVRPIVADISELEYGAWFNISRRLRKLDHGVLTAIEKRLLIIAHRVKSLGLLADITVANYCVRLARLLKPRDAAGRPRQPLSRRDFLHIRSLNPIPRETHGRFQLHRNDPQHGLVWVDLLGLVSRREALREAALRRKQQRSDASPAANVATPTNGQEGAPIPPVLLESKEADERAAILGGAASTPTGNGTAAPKPTIDDATTPTARPAGTDTPPPAPAKPPAKSRRNRDREL